jgi:8-oxo-dGTP pyrophosphatase MutT (NUDIX family)
MTSDIRADLVARYRAGMARDGIDLITNDWVTKDTGTFRQTAVLAAITARPRPGLLLLQRPAAMRTHAGHIALPGGKLDPGETHLEAALRETEEELGIDRTLVDVIGPCDPMLTGTMFEMVPILAIVPADLTIIPNDEEVAEWFEVPLDHVLDPAQHLREWHEIGQHRLEAWTINWQGRKIWGATAMIIINIARRLG